MPTPQSSAPGRLLRFGAFEVDLLAGELRKNGLRIRMQEQPFQVLALLLERAGDIVTREELRQRLWPADTFVDFDHSLNTAINKIRDALGDSAATPRYIETLARRGYRFVVPVQRLDTPPGAPKLTPGPQPGATTLPVISTSPTPGSVPIHPELEVPIPHRGMTRGLFILIQVMYLSFYLAALFHLSQIEAIADSFLPGGSAFAILAAVLITTGIGIPLRCYLLSAVAFDHIKTGEKFQRLFLLILPLDQLWAVAPFLLLQKIGLGVSFAATAALLYVPFSERTLVRMAYPGRYGQSD
jgi:cholera toxin transcriptional activator